MIDLLFGLVLIVVPFLAIKLFSNKRDGFVFVLFFVILFHTLLAIITQFFGIFYYSVVLGAALLADLILLFLIFRKKNLQVTSYKLQVASFKKIDWVLVFVIVVGFLTLYQVHFNYTGKINLATDQTVSYHEAKNINYVYPYFSDEWYAVALINSSISLHHLPTTNPFDNSFFANLELFFHSFVSEIVLILNLNATAQYTLLSIFVNLLIIILAYLYLLQNNVSKIISGISALSCLYITCGANVPGLWHLIPFNLGIILFLILMYFAKTNNFKITALCFLLGCAFYLPMFVFYFLGFAYVVFMHYKNQQKLLFKMLGILGLILFVVLPVIILILLILPTAGALNYIFSRLFFNSFFAPYMPQYAVYNMILWPVILFAIVGIYSAYRSNKLIFLQFLFLIFMWSTYSFTSFRFMIEYERVVILASIIITIIAGLGLNFVFQNLKFTWLKYLQVYFLLLFLVFVPFYTQRQMWQKLVLLEPKTGLVGYAKAPANNYLTVDDLRIFSNIKNAKFLSLPWKGTVLGTSTNNYPVVTKEGTLSMGKEAWVNNFLMANCADKIKMAKNWDVQYVYLPKFDCNNFAEVDESKENLVLYKVNYNAN